MQRLQRGIIPRHRHGWPYAAMVLEGRYLETGSTGRWWAEPGDILLHRSFEAHWNEISSRSSLVLNLELADDYGLPPLFSVADPDALIRAARKREITAELLIPTSERLPLDADWPDLLASALRRKPVRLNEWADKMGLAPETVSRGFTKVFRIGPAQYRAEVQALVALQQVRGSSDSLTQIAYDCGYSDQAHLGRSLKRLTGRTPRSWRINSVQYSSP